MGRHTVVSGLLICAAMSVTGCWMERDAQDYIDRIDYVVELVGIAHVAIGTDLHEGFTIGSPIMWRATTKRRYPDMVGRFEHHDIYVDGFSRLTEIGNVFEGLVCRGYSGEDIEKITGGNALRVFQECSEKSE